MLEVFEVTPQLRFSLGILKQILPDVETTLFFAKVYELDHRQLSHLLQAVHQSTLTDALFGGDHSTELQDYLVDITHQAQLLDGEIALSEDVNPGGDILPEVWKSLEIEVAQAIKDVAAKISSTINLLPGKQGSMVFKTLAKVNAKRPVIGDYRAQIHHGRQLPNLLIMDVSGSVSSGTVAAIVEDVVGLSYMADAHLAIVSDSCFHWEPGTYNVEKVLEAAQYGGTHYEELAGLFDQRQEWGTVICVADYDSSASAQQHLRRVCNATIHRMLDISLVDRATYLGECIGWMAQEIQPLLIGNSHRVLGSSNNWW